MKKKEYSVLRNHLGCDFVVRLPAERAGGPISILQITDTQLKFYLEGRSEDCLQQILSHPQSERDRNLISSFQQEKDFLSKCCDRIIVASRHSYKLLQSAYGIDQNQLFYIPHGMCDTYRKRSEQELEAIVNASWGTLNSFCPE